MTMNNNISSLDELDDLIEAAETAEDGESETASTVGSLTEGGDDRKDPAHEPARITPEEWAAGSYYAVTITADPGDRAKAGTVDAKGYEEYIEARAFLHEKGYYITREDFQTREQYFPGLLTYESIIDEFETADESYIEMEHFPEFCKVAKIRAHDSVVIAGDTGGGKSALALNFLNDLCGKYPILYFNLEMDRISILRRLIAIRNKKPVANYENYQGSERTAGEVKAAVRSMDLSRHHVQLFDNVFCLENKKDEDGNRVPGVKSIIRRTTEGREEPTIVIIDHGLLLETGNAKIDRDPYNHATEVSQRLRQLARKYNIIMFTILQQNRASKANAKERPANSSLKESGSWENDSTHVVFMWWDPEAQRRKLVLTKNRGGVSDRDFIIDFWKDKQVIVEARNQGPAGALDIRGMELEKGGRKKPRKRDEERRKLSEAREAIIARIGRDPVPEEDLRRLFADELDKSTRQVRTLEKEYGFSLEDGLFSLSIIDALEVPFQDQEEEEDIFIE